MRNSTYFHILNGRMRLRIAGVKGSPEKAAAVEKELANLAGVTEVTANPVTGNVLILWDSNTLTQQQILEFLMRQGYLNGAINLKPRSPISIEMENNLAHYLAQSTLEVGLKLLVSALI